MATIIFKDNVFGGIKFNADYGVLTLIVIIKIPEVEIITASLMQSISFLER